jgi:hypothetical protein
MPRRTGTLTPPARPRAAVSMRAILAELGPRTVANLGF